MPTYSTSIEFSDTNDGREIRQRWIDQHNPGVRAATMATVNAIPEAEGTFIDGYFLGSFAVAVSTIEQILHEQLSENDDHPWSLRTIVTEASTNGVIDRSLKEQLLDINELRRSKFHYRGKKDPHGMEGHIFQRVNEQGQSPQDIRGDDAKTALQALYGVLEVAEIDIDSDKLP